MMLEMLRLGHAAQESEAGFSFGRISVLLSGDVTGLAGPSRCLVRSIWADGVQLETNLQVEVGEHIRLTLAGERRLQGTVARCAAGQVELLCKFMPDWARSLCKPVNSQ